MIKKTYRADIDGLRAIAVMLVFAKHAMGEDLKINGRVGIGIVSIAVATLSWRFVELPFRLKQRITNRQSWAFLGAALALLGAFVAVILLSDGLSKRFTPKVAELDRARVREVVRPECIDFRVPLNDKTACRIGAQGDPTVMVWGDSHAHAMLPSFDTAFRSLGVAAWFATESGCPPLPLAQVSFRGRDNWRCREHNDKVVKFIGEHLGLEKIVLVAAWNSYADEAGGYELSTRTSGKSAAALKKSIEELAQWQYPDQKSRELIVISQIPSFEWNVPHKMLDRELKGKPIPPLTRQEWLNKSTKSRDVFESLAISKHIILVDSSEWFCNTGTCSYASNNDQPLYWDGGHINAIGAMFITPFLEMEFRQYFLDSEDLKRK